MWLVIVLVFAQYGVTVQVIDARLGVSYKTPQACHKAANKLSGPVPASDGYAAQWEVAICQKVVS